MTSPEEHGFIYIYRNGAPSISPFNDLLISELNDSWSYLQSLLASEGDDSFCQSRLVPLMLLDITKKNKRLEPLVDAFHALTQEVNSCADDYMVSLATRHYSENKYSVIELNHRNETDTLPSSNIPGDPQTIISSLVPLQDKNADVSFTLVDQRFELEMGDVIIVPSGWPFDKSLNFCGGHTMFLQGFYR